MEIFKNNNNYSRYVLFFILIFLSFVESIKITYTSAYKAYEGGGNTFVIVGTDFPNDVRPTVILSGGKDPLEFPFKGRDGDAYGYTVIPSPMSSFGKKRKLNSEKYTLEIYFDINDQPYRSNPFYYIEPIVSNIEPSEYYPISSDRVITIIGDYFQLNNWDADPTVRLERGDGNPLPMTIKKVTPTKIACNLPNVNDLHSYQVVVTSYTGLDSNSDVYFNFIKPRITKVYPDHTVSTTPTSIQVYGEDLYDVLTLPISIKINGADCTNIMVDQYENIFTCVTPVVNLVPGDHVQQQISLNIGGNDAEGTVGFFFYHPVVKSFSPKFGPPTGGTDIVIIGQFLSEVINVYVGTVKCFVIKESVTTNSITCRTGEINMADKSEISNKVQVDIGKGTFFSPDKEVFTYYKPVITAISPAQIIDKGTWKVTVTGTGFYLNNKVKISPDKSYTPAGTSNDKILYFEVDASKLAIGEHDLHVSSGMDSAAIKFKVAKPEVSAVNPANGYLFSETTMTLTVKDFPIGLTAEDLPKTIEVKVGDKVCGKLTQVNPTTLTCVIPAGDTAKEEDISFFIQKVEYKTTLKFTYFEPKVTKQTQSSTILKGGGNLVIDGTNLDVVEKVKVDNIEITNCYFQPTQITCTLLQHAPGSVNVILFVKDSKNVYHEYNTGTQVNYIGPTISQVAPQQGSKQKAYTLTLTGTGFGASANLITISVGGTNCGSIVLVSTTQVLCNIPKLAAGTYNVVVKVKPNSVSTAVESIDVKTYRSYPLKCLGLPNADNTNDPVDWWFIYKLRYSDDNPYVYIDSTMTDQKLVRRTGLQESTVTLSPIQATFAQYTDYRYMFFNDQPGSRYDGAQDQKRGKTLGAHGHLKTMIIFEELDINGVSPGIHIHHSNPVTPSFATKKTYNNYDSGNNFLGNPDLNQHYFCYQYADLDHVAEYISKNDGNLMEGYKVFDTIKTWTQVQMNRYPYLYDFLKPHMTLTERIPISADRPLTYPKSLKQTCDSNIAKTTDLEDICYWISDERQIANGQLKAYYFMKIGNNNVVPVYPSVNKPRPLTMNQFIVKKETNKPTYDGIDIWLVVSDHFNKKLFVESFIKGNKQMRPSENIVNVGYLELPPDLADKSGVAPNFTYRKNRFTPRSNEHAKMGWPVYPAYGDKKYNDDENYFCVGDSNRHNGQAGRGGGSICFQHPVLVYQFNRMVRQYNTLTENGQFTSPSDGNTIELFISIAQPIKVYRPNTWVNSIQVEVKDFIKDEHHSKTPNEIYSITSATFLDASDVVAYFPALRTSFDNVASNKGEKSVTTNPTLETDIFEYSADDVMSLHYFAYDQQHATVCQYKAGITDCNQNSARTTIMTKVVGIGYVLPIFPPRYRYPYGSVRPTYTFDLSNHNDFQLIQFTSKFKTKLPGALVSFYKYVVDSSNNIVSARFIPPIIYRVRDDLCGEEVAYFMTLHYIYNQARSADDSNIIYTIGSDNPNWANGIILAISKKLYNDLVGANANFDGCMDDIFSGFANIETYIDNKEMDNPTADQIVRRSAATAWDWIHNKYADGNGAKVNRAANDDIIPITDLINLMINLKKSDNVNSIDGLAPFLDQKYRTDINFKTILENNYIIKPPPPKTKDEKDENGDIVMKLLQLPNFSFKSTRNLQSMTFNEFTVSSLVQDEIEIDTGIHQLISTSTNTINESNIISLTSYKEERLELAIDKWIVINNQSQAIQTLIIDPMTQYHDQPILFIDEFNRDQNGNQIDLASETVGTTGNRLSISTPLSISSITFVLESIIISESTGMKSFGDFEIYYLPKPNNYNGDISSDYHGMIISTINSQLCDIKMISESDFNSNKFDSICTQSGPIITSIDKLFGSTNGGYPITLNGIRFNSSMIISIGDNKCDSTILLSSEKIICQVPKGSGIQHEIQISTEQTLFNLQRSKYLFSYNQPTINSIEPKTIDSYGGDLLTIYGSNFGDNVLNVQVLINEKLECTSVGISSDHIVCVTPSSIGDHLSITVHVNGQSTILDLDLIQSQDISFSGPYITGISPKSGDPEDSITIIGEGFGDSEDSENPPPLIYIGDNLVEIVYFTNQEIVFTLDYETSSQPFIIQVGDQYLTTEFDYYPPLITQFNNTKVGTSGGLIQISGFGFGVSSSDLDFTLNGNEIECNSFDQFIECYIPAGIGSNYTLNGSISNQTVDFGNNNLISYSAPTLESYTIKDDFTLELFGTNFVPVDLGVSFNSNTSFVNLIFEDVTQTCSTFKSSTEISCYLLNIPSSVEVIVAGQKSGILLITP